MTAICGSTGMTAICGSTGLTWLFYVKVSQMLFLSFLFTPRRNNVEHETLGNTDLAPRLLQVVVSTFIPFP